MPTLRFLSLTIVVVALLAITPGCKKSQSQTPKQDRYGIGIDWPKLDIEFTNNDPMVQASASSIKRSILYHQFSQAVADLETLARHPALTDAQKKILSDLREQTQQVMAKAPSAQPTQ